MEDTEVRVQVQKGSMELEVRVGAWMEEAAVINGDKAVQTRFYHG